MRSSTSSDCHYEIEWSTSAACKHNKEESGSCVVDDPHSAVQYNFKPLAKQFTVSQLFTTTQVQYSTVHVQVTLPIHYVLIFSALQCTCMLIRGIYYLFSKLYFGLFFFKLLCYIFIFSKTHATKVYNDIFHYTHTACV